MAVIQTSTTHRLSARAEVHRISGAGPQITPPGYIEDVSPDDDDENLVEHQRWAAFQEVVQLSQWQTEGRKMVQLSQGQDLQHQNPQTVRSLLSPDHKYCSIPPWADA